MEENTNGIALAVPSGLLLRLFRAIYVSVTPENSWIVGVPSLPSYAVCRALVVSRGCVLNGNVRRAAHLGLGENPVEATAGCHTVRMRRCYRRRISLPGDTIVVCYISYLIVFLSPLAQ